MKLQALFVSILLALAGLGAAQAAECGPLKMVNTVQMIRPPEDDRDMIPVQINGKDLSFLFDTGGVTTMIGKDVALDLKLPVRQGNMEFFDATGNEGQLLSRREPAWKLRTVVSRERPEDFAPEEQLVLTNLPIPQPGSFLGIDQTINRGGVRLKVFFLAGAGEFGASNQVGSLMLPFTAKGSAGWKASATSVSTTAVEPWRSSTPFLLVETSPSQADYKPHLQFCAFDNEGVEAKVESNQYGIQPEGSRLYRPKFDLSPGARSVTVQIIVNRPLQFEFMVNPKDVRGVKP